MTVKELRKVVTINRLHVEKLNSFWANRDNVTREDIEEFGDCEVMAVVPLALSTEIDSGNNKQTILYSEILVMAKEV